MILPPPILVEYEEEEEEEGDEDDVAGIGDESNEGSCSGGANEPYEGDAEVSWSDWDPRVPKTITMAI